VKVWARVAPGAFVVIWSTGFIGARYGLPYAAPLTLLGVRMALATAVFALLVLALRSPHLMGRRQYSRSAIVGILLHAVYLGGLFMAIDLGLAVSVTVAGRAASAATRSGCRASHSRWKAYACAGVMRAAGHAFSHRTSASAAATDDESPPDDDEPALLAHQVGRLMMDESLFSRNGPGVPLGRYWMMMRVHAEYVCMYVLEYGTYACLYEHMYARVLDYC
jgi:hypothetical protein